MNEEIEGAGAGDGAPRNEPINESAPQGAPQSGGAAFGDDPNNRRPRRRGRRGRGGGGGQPFQPARGPMPQGARPAQPFRGPARGPGFAPRPMPRPMDDEGSLQARELAAYERRQQQAQRRTTGGWRPGAPFRGPAMGGGPQPFRGAGPQYAEQIRRATSGPARGAAPSHEAGEPIAGPHAVLEAMRAGRAIRKLYIAQDRSVRTGPVNDLIAEAQERRIFVNYLDKLDLSRLSPVENHQGVVAIFEGRAGVDLDELIVHLDATNGQPLVLLASTHCRIPAELSACCSTPRRVRGRRRRRDPTPSLRSAHPGRRENECRYEAELLSMPRSQTSEAIRALKEKGLCVVWSPIRPATCSDEVTTIAGRTRHRW